ncbi:hypothetical protein K2O51_19095 [Cupriavidus pinatubonensis]|nr:hypothetical protein [Cupriavidus pinatubonensis]QYY33375.1 hypothetical protein K2O51_19095 [Cupriavidus pinatubonensis]TPQ38532.1 hypothetical protein C2U69_14245 [Cupriavidus pinatubonensis]
MPLYQSDSILLEAHYFGDDAEYMRLSCAHVSVGNGAIVVQGIEPRQLQGLRWTPDFLSFDVSGNHHRYPVGRPAFIGPDRAQFALL